LERGEARVLKLVVAVARKVIHQEVSTDRDVILGVLREAVKNVLDRDRIKVRMSPRDRERLSKLTPGLIAGFEGIRSVVLEADESIGPGGAVIETAFGEVDATVEQQLEEILKAFLESTQKA
jgi:flagellar assembly protein FliH